MMNSIQELIHNKEFEIGQRVYFNLPETETIGIVIGYIVYESTLEYQIRTEQGVFQLEEFFLSADKIIV